MTTEDRGPRRPEPGQVWIDRIGSRVRVIERIQDASGEWLYPVELPGGRTAHFTRFDLVRRADDGEPQKPGPAPAPTPSARDAQVGGGHYKGMPIQPVEFIHANGIGFCEGAVIKYVTRHKAKNGAEDLRKARHFIDLLLELEYGVKP